MGKQGGDYGGGGVHRDEIVVRKEKILKAIVGFDANVSALTKDSTKDSSKELIKMTDEMRDVILPQFGIKIEDLEGAKGSIWKLYDPKALLKMLKRGDIKKINNQIKH